jgi:hypothetical protein
LDAGEGPTIVVAQIGEVNTGAVDPMPEIVRLARGFAVYAALRELGRRGVAERCCGCARLMAEEPARDPRVTVLSVCNWRTTEADIRRSAEAILAASGSVRPRHGCR